MPEFRRSNWTTRVDLSPHDRIELRAAIAAERQYYNAVLDGLAGPIRTMPDTIKALTGRWEALVGTLAALGRSPASLKPDTLPAELAAYADLLFQNGRLALDSKTQVVCDVMASPRGCLPTVRREIALELLRYAREQVAALANPLDRADQVYKFAVQTLVPLDPASKRHVQIPKKLVQIAEADEIGCVDVRLPFLTTAITMPVPPAGWNYLFLREDLDGRCTLELGSNTTYQLKRTDLSQYRKKARRA